MYGSDALNALEPNDFRTYSQSIRDVWTMLSHPVDKNDTSCYIDMKRTFEKSIVTGRLIRKGELISFADLSFKKPGDGIPASQYKTLIGRQAKHDLLPNQQITLDDFE